MFLWHRGRRVSLFLLAERIFLAACFGLFLLDGRGADDVSWGEEIHGLRFGIASARSEFNIRDVVELELNLQNVAEVPQSISHFFYWTDLEFIVTDRNRTRLPPRDPADGRGLMLSGKGPRTLLSSETELHRVPLRAFVHLDKPGEYLVTAIRRIGLFYPASVIEVKSGNLLVPLSENVPPSTTNSVAVESYLSGTTVKAELERIVHPSTSRAEPSESNAMPEGIAGKEEVFRQRGMNGGTTIEPSAARLDSSDPSSPAAIFRPDIPVTAFSTQPRLIGGVVALLSALLLALLCRAARRRS